MEVHYGDPSKQMKHYTHSWTEIRGRVGGQTLAAPGAVRSHWQNLSWDQTVQWAAEGDGWRTEVSRCGGRRGGSGAGTEGSELVGRRAVKLIRPPFLHRRSSQHTCIVLTHTGAPLILPSSPQRQRVQVHSWESTLCDYSFICSLCLFLSSLHASLGPARGEYISTAWKKQPLPQMLITAGHITAAPFFRFAFPSLYYSSPQPLCSSFHLFTARGRKYSYRWKLCVPPFQMFLVRQPFLKAFISSAVRPQNFHSIVTPNKHPNCKNCRPARAKSLAWG